MQGVKRVSRKLGFGTAPMPVADPNVHEAICPLCGVYGPLNRMGWCYDRACKEAVRDELRREAAESESGVVPGQYYKVGGTELINLAVFESFEEPVSPIKHPDMCVLEACETWARPSDTLCPEHRLQANQSKHDALRRNRQGKARRTKGRDRKIGRIKGLGSIKLGNK